MTCTICKTVVEWNDECPHCWHAGTEENGLYICGVCGEVVSWDSNLEILVTDE